MKAGSRAGSNGLGNTCLVLASLHSLNKWSSGKPGAIYLPTALVMNNPLRVSRHEIRDPLIAHGAKPEEQLPHRVID